MSLVQGKWINLDPKGTGPGTRCSHAITLVGQKAYVFGGEFTQRFPVDNKLHVFDIKEQTWHVIEGTGDVQPPRVGVTLVAIGEIIYVVGGWDYEHNELNELYSFDTSTQKWTLISSGDTGPLTGVTTQSTPMTTTYTSSVDVVLPAASMIYGPTMSLIKSGSNTQIPVQLEGEGWGGPARGPRKNMGCVWFAGEEVDDVHIFDPARGEWAQVETNGEKPTARSVFSTVAIGKYIIIYSGEVDPSDLGHLGAGKFASKVYALDTETLLWKKWDNGRGSGHHPGACGWCAFARGQWDGKEGLLVYGGNSPTNDGLGDIHFFIP